MDEKMFVSELLKLGISCDSYKLDLLNNYYKLLVTFNSKMNLTAITEKKMVYLKHFYDSLTISKVIDLNKIVYLCDIGTGAGFPGIVLKIFFPHIKLTLIDSLRKRINFLNEVVRLLNLEDVETLHTRAEDFSRISFEKYDVVTARAVSSFNILLEYSIPMIKKGMFFVSLRGKDDTDNCDQALRKLNSVIEKKVSFKLPVENSDRTVILVKKIGKTSKMFPRKYSDIKKHPL